MKQLFPKQTVKISAGNVILIGQGLGAAAAISAGCLETNVATIIAIDPKVDNMKILGKNFKFLIFPFFRPIFALS